MNHRSSFSAMMTRGASLVRVLNPPGLLGGKRLGGLMLSLKMNNSRSASSRSRLTGLAVLVLAVSLFGGTVAGAQASSVPGAPTQLSVVWSSGEVTLSWQPPASDGGSAVSGYEYRYWVVDEDAADNWTSLSADALAVTVDDLTDDVAYRFELRAVNSVGSGASDTIDVTPLTTFAIAAFGLSRGGSTGVADTTAACGATLPDDSLAGSARDRAVLEVLYSCTDGANWYRNTNWQSSLPLGQWSGVNVDGDGRVTTLELSNNWMVGNLPAVIGELSKLTVLRIDRSFLSGTLPASLGNLSELTELDLSRNELTGNLPAAIGELSRLTVLKLDRNNLSGTLPASLGSLADLAELDLSRNSFSGGLPSQLGDLANLKTLELSWNDISGEIPSTLGALTAVTAIYLHMNELTGPIPTQFGNLSKLEVLELTHNVTEATAGIDGAIPAELGQLSNLKRLSVGWNDLSGSIPPELGRLSNLESLFLVWNRLSGTIPSELGQLTNLQSLRLSGNSLSGQIPHSLGGLPQLYTAHFSENQLRGCLPVGLESVTFWPDFSFLQVAGAGGERSQMPWCGLKRLSVVGHVLEPRFAISTTSYDVEVGHNIEQVTIEYEADDEAAKVAIKDENGDAISDSDDQTAGFQVSLTSLQAGDTLTLSLSVTATSPSPQAVEYTLAVSQLGNRAPVIASENSSATGRPTISGTAEFGETLSAVVTAIDDEDGLENAAFTYQWIRNDGSEDTNIQDATSVDYTPVKADVGKTLKVQVSFTDDADNEETLTSAATVAVAAALPTEPLNLTVATGSQIQELDASWQIPASDGGSDITGYRVQWKEATGSWDTAADLSQATVTGTTYTITGLTGGVEYAVRVMATNDMGDGPVSFEATGRPAGSISQQNAVPENSAPTGDPVIVGTAQVGQTLTADTTAITDEDGLTNAVFSYQWVRSDGGTDTDIQGATASSYTLTEDDKGKTITVTVSFTDAEGNLETLTSDPTGEVKAKPNIQATGLPTISGTARVGETLTADTSAIADEDGLDSAVFSYRWIRNDGTEDADIPGATGSTHTPDENDVGKTLKVRVSFTDDAGHEESLTSPPTAAVTAPPLTATLDSVPASHDGATEFTFELHFSEEFKLSYTVLRDDAFTVTGGTVSRATRVDKGFNIKRKIHVQPDGDGGVTIVLAATTDCAADGAICTVDGRKLSIRLELTVSGPGGAPTTTDEPAPNTQATGQPTISGTVQVGETLMADTSEIADEDGLTNPGFTYQWARNDGATDTDIQGATASSYTLTEDDEGKTITVTVSFTDAEGNPETLTSDPTGEVAAKPNIQATGVPTISGTAQVGETLAADVTGIADEDGLDNVTFSYQWMADDVNIQDATGSNYTLVSDDEGKTIKVTVSFTDDEDNPETLTSDPTGKVAAKPNSQATGAPTITGTAQVGQTLTASTAGIADADGLEDATFTYQWRADDVAIAGASGSGYTLTQAELGKTIKVKVSFTDDAGNEETRTSARTGAVAGLPPARPTGLTTSATHDAVTLTWDDPGDGSITRYEVYRRVTGQDALGEFELIESDTGSAEAAYTDDDVSPETRYTYRVKAVNPHGASQRSGYSSITTPATPDPTP